MTDIANDNVENAYKALSTGKERVAFRLFSSVDKNVGFATIGVDLCFVKNMDVKFNSSMAFYDNGYNDKHHYKNLQLLSTSYCNFLEPSDPKLQFSSVLSNTVIDLDQAESMVKTLRPILRKLRKIEDEEGYVNTFEEVVIRLSRILKVKSFYIQQANGFQWERNDSMSEFRAAIKDMISSNAENLSDAAA